MPVDATSLRPGPAGATGTTGGIAGAATNGASKEQFLKLFVAQIEYQNPLEPQDGAQFVAQLAQFASLEQQIAGNERLDNLALAQMSAARGSLLTLVGRSVSADASSLEWDPSLGGMPAMKVDLQSSGNVEVVVTDAAGNEVRHVDLGRRSAGESSFQFDFRSDSGAPLPPGNYQFVVRAKNADGAEIRGSVLAQARVDGVSFEGGSSNIQLGGVVIAPDHIQRVEE